MTILHLRLFITGRSKRTEAAIANLRSLLDKELKGNYDLAINDVLQNPEMAGEQKILATPTLIRELPLPVKRIISDFSDAEKVLNSLDLPPLRGDAELKRRLEQWSALRASDAPFGNIIAKSAEGIIILDIEGIIRFANPAAVSIFDRKAAELMGHPFGFPVVGETSELVIVSRKGKRAIEMRIVETEWGEREQAFVANLRDITEAKKTLEALRASEERYRALVRASAQALYRMSPDWREMRTLQVEDFVPDTEKSNRNWLQDYIPPDEQKRVLEAIHQAVSTASIFELEHRVRRVDGTMGWVVSRAVPVRDADGEIVEWFGATTDITERKQMEEHVRELNVELEAANRELEAFNYTVAHDLRKPLTVVDGYLQVLAELCGDNLADDCKGYVREACHGTGRMNRLISDLLDFSRAVHAEPKREKVNLSIISAEVASELKQAEPERRVTFRMPDEVPAYADPALLRIVLSNLLGNAWKYTVTREVGIIEFGMAEGDGGPAYFVRDNGIGFDQSDADKLFEVFQRLQGSMVAEGMGIGLATVARVIERHGGKVWAEGAPGKGATFYFTLPQKSS